MPIQKWVLFPSRTPNVVEHDLLYDITLRECCQKINAGQRNSCRRGRKIVYH